MTKTKFRKHYHHHHHEMNITHRFPCWLHLNSFACNLFHPINTITFIHNNAQHRDSHEVLHNFQLQTGRTKKFLISFRVTVENCVGVAKPITSFSYIPFLVKSLAIWMWNFRKCCHQPTHAFPSDYPSPPSSPSCAISSHRTMLWQHMHQWYNFRPFCYFKTKNAVIFVWRVGE